MQPTRDEFLKGSTQWRFDNDGIPYIVAYHGYSDDPKWPHPGIWCYYLLIDELLFEAKDFKKMVMKRRKNYWGMAYDYHSFPDFHFHGGVTFYEINKSWDKKNKKEVRCLKVGCDYNHLWDEEVGYHYSLDSVKIDAELSIARLNEMFPNRKLLCKYSGWVDTKENFYVSKNGWTIHKNFLNKIKFLPLRHMQRLLQ